MSPAFTVTATPPSLRSSDDGSNVVPTRQLIPRLSNCLRSSWPIASSSSGTRLGAISTSVTSQPTLRQNDANSTPTAPAPSTIALGGMESRKSASSLVSTWRPSVAMPGSCRALEPVATMMWPVSSSTWSPPPSAVTTTRPGPVIRPRPCTVVALFFFSNPCTPRYSVLTTSSRRIAAMP